MSSQGVVDEVRFPPPRSEELALCSEDVVEAAGEIPQQKQLLLTEVPPPIPEEIDEDLFDDAVSSFIIEHASLQRSEVMAVGSKEETAKERVA